MNMNFAFNELSKYSLLILFPGFFIYHSMVAMSFIPAFLGGYFSLMSVALLGIYAFFSLFINKIRKELLLPYFVFIFWFVMVSIFYFLGDKQTNDYILYQWSLIAIISNIICFCIFSNLNLNGKIKRSLIFSLCLMVVIILLNIDSSGRFLLAVSDNDSVASYQAFGRSLLVVGFITFILTQGWSRFLIVVLSIFALYFNTARSEFVCFIIAIVLYYGLDFLIKRNSLNKYINLFLIIVIVSGGIYFMKQITFDDLNRTAQLIDISNSSSFAGRKELQDYAVNSIVNNIFFGNYGYYMDRFGKGGYVHNALSILADFGLFAFIFYVFSVVYLWIYSIVQFFKMSSDNHYIKLLLLCSTCLLIVMITSKDYSYMFLGIVSGIYFNRNIQSN
ncbi:hypothetical protein [Moraxella sp. ZY210820]|uniref:hypothetical protein n=1 Tax=unclassified Moraxella TaxID=2685852 RepID=UPI00272F3E6A|nr:hypothetical protein [Moraxella sp. ZY210820]WLF83692.1 hypothetical protein LU301_10620 [Moraxella sp. ZY210820]